MPENIKKNSYSTSVSLDRATHIHAINIMCNKVAKTKSRKFKKVITYVLHKVKHQHSVTVWLKIMLKTSSDVMRYLKTMHGVKICLKHGNNKTLRNQSNLFLFTLMTGQTSYYTLKRASRPTVYSVGIRAQNEPRECLHIS